jgi:hypothetical protein
MMLSWFKNRKYIVKNYSQTYTLLKAFPKSSHFHILHHQLTCQQKQVRKEPIGNQKLKIIILI